MGLCNVRVLAAIAALAIADRAAAAAGNGVRLGGSEGRLHPFVELETRNDSNVFFAEDGSRGGDVVLHVRPGFVLGVPGELTTLNLRAALDWAQYLGVDGDTTDLSRLYGEASLGVAVNRRGQLGLEVTDAFRRSAGTTAYSLGSAVIANNNAFRVAVPWKPGGGALLLTLGGEWQLESYEPYLDGALCDVASGLAQCDSEALADLGWNELRGTGELRWKFLPRTAAVLDASFFDRIPNETAVAPDVAGFRLSTGFTGLVTARVAGTLKAGYGQTLGDVDVRTWLLAAEAEWLATETAGIRVGYLHDVGVDPGNVYTVFRSHRVYGDARILAAGRYTGRLYGHVEARGYELPAAVGDASTTLFRVEPSIEAEVTRWVRFSVGYAYTNRTSDLPAGTPALPGFDYSKNEVWLRSVLTY